MPIAIEYASYHTHAAHCPRCRRVDFPSQLCRIGRRLFWRYLSEMSLEARTVFTMGLDEDIRAEVVAHFRDDGTEIMNIEMTDTNKGEN